MSEKKVLIGSKAMEHHLPGLLKRAPADEDYLSLTPVTEGDWVRGHGIMEEYSFEEPIASLSEIYTLKVSHSPWVLKGSLPHWYKHIYDVAFLKAHGAELIPELHQVAYKEWERREGVKNVNLNKTKEEFFGSAVVRYFDHDSVHEAVALGVRPGFYKILEPGSEVKTSRKLWEALTDEERARLVFEEVMVLSLERDLIPLSQAGKEVDIFALFESFSKQLRFLTTKYSKGWFPQWIIEHYPLVNTPPLNYWGLFQDSDKKVPLLGAVSS